MFSPFSLKRLRPTTPLNPLPTHSLTDMDHSIDFDFPKTENSDGLLNCFYSVEQTERDRIMELSPLEGFFELDDWLPQLPYQSNQLCEFPDVENFSCGLELPPFDQDFVVDKKPLNIVAATTGHCNRESFASGYGEASMMNANGFATSVKKEVENQERPKSSRKKRSVVLEFEEIRKHFDVPITEAAKQMNVGLTLLKRRCRELNIMRWPHRKIKSLNSLIHNVKELGLTKEVAMLKQNIRVMEKLPDMELNENTKKLRQACFKANYKRRRSLARQA